MADNSRIEDLRRRVQKDPASIAFAQLAEECRRAGQYDEAVEVCRAGLQLHPGYLSARVTLGRALIELDDLDTAFAELDTVLKSAPENLAAIRGVAEIHHRRRDFPAALAQYRIALALARNDPDLQRTVDELARDVEPPPPPDNEGLSFEQMQSEFLKLGPPPVAAAPVRPEQPATASAEARSAALDAVAPVELGEAAHQAQAAAHPAGNDVAASEPPAAEPRGSQHAASEDGEADSGAKETAAKESTAQTLAELERFLNAVHVARAERGA